MRIDIECCHDVELLDNCFFTSRGKVEAAVQTMFIGQVDRAISIMTPFSDASQSAKGQQTNSKKSQKLS